MTASVHVAQNPCVTRRRARTALSLECLLIGRAISALADDRRHPMMDLAILMIQMAFVAFLAWGGVLSLLSVVRGGTRDSRAARMKIFSYAAANDFETDFRRVLSRRSTITAI